MLLFVSYLVLSCSTWALISISSTGDLERLRRFWLTGTCNPRKEEKKASEPLAPEQFLSAFVLLACGIALAAGLTGLEHAYVRWIRVRVARRDEAGCCALVSKVRFSGSVTGCLQSL